MTTKQRPDATAETTPTTAPGHVTVVRIPRFDDTRDEKFTQIAVTSAETLTRLVDIVERLAAERERPTPAVPALRSPAASTLAEPADLSECRVMSVPLLTTFFVALMDRARDLGLRFPPVQAWRLTWADAPQFRKQDGLTVRASSGFVTVYLNINTPSASFARTVYHELAHLSDYCVHADSLSVEEMERRAEAFARRATSPPPPAPKPLPEPVRVRDLSSWHGAGSRTSYSVGIERLAAEEWR